MSTKDICDMDLYEVTQLVGESNNFSSINPCLSDETNEVDKWQYPVNS